MSEAQNTPPVENAISPTCTFGAPIGGDPHWNFTKTFGTMPSLGYPCSVICAMICLAALIVVTNRQTNGKTDRMTHGYSIYRADIALRGKKKGKENKDEDAHAVTCKLLQIGVEFL